MRARAISVKEHLLVRRSAGSVGVVVARQRSARHERQVFAIRGDARGRRLQVVGTGFLYFRRFRGSPVRVVFAREPGDPPRGFPSPAGVVVDVEVAARAARRTEVAVARLGPFSQDAVGDEVDQRPSSLAITSPWTPAPSPLFRSGVRSVTRSPSGLSASNTYRSRGWRWSLLRAPSSWLSGAGCR